MHALHAHHWQQAPRTADLNLKLKKVCLGCFVRAVPKLAVYKAPAGANFFKGRFGAANGAGVASAKSFAIFGGVFAASTCWVTRLRDKEDGELAWLSVLLSKSDVELERGIKVAFLTFCSANFNACKGLQIPE